MEALKLEQHGASTRLFSDHLDDWRRWLFPHLSEELFVDAYAQTVTFGLLLARRSGVVLEGKEFPTIGRELAKNHLLVGRALSILTEHDDGPSIEARSVALQTLRRVIGISDWTYWRADSFDQLYEKFLDLYDAELRQESGSYFTARPIADFVVRIVDGLLETELGRRLGFAHRDVVVVDPAMGTGTFLVSTIERAAANVAADGGDQPGELHALLARLIGFERQIAPYAVAELKLHQELAAQGLEVSDEKVRFYVTDTLDDPNVEMLSSPYVYRPIAESRRQAIRVKIDECVMVVMGNPPYLENARSQGGVILARNRGRRSLLDDFRGRGTGRREIKLHNLNIYFWRWACWKVFEAHPEHPEGVVAFITTSAYTTGPGFMGMREYLRRQADFGWIVDLSPERQRADVPTRVFPGVQQPVCIGIFVRKGRPNRESPARVRYLALQGTKVEKFEQLNALTLQDNSWMDCPIEWTAPFRPIGGARWSEQPSFAELTWWSSPGLKPNRRWVYSPDPAVLNERWRRLLLSDPTERQELMKETRDRTLDLRMTPGFDGSGVPRTLTAERPGRPRAERVAFRSFDRQYVIADRRVVDFPRSDLWAIKGPQQVFATTLSTEPLTCGPAVVFAADVPDMDHMTGRGGRVVPLYLDAHGKFPNFPPHLIEVIARVLAVKVVPADLMAYIAGVASHGGFTECYRRQLETPGVRIPLTAERDLWRRAVAAGRRVIWLHTYGERYVDSSDGRPSGPPLHLRPRVVVPFPATTDAMPEQIEYRESDMSLVVGHGVLAPVGPAVWSYEVSGNRVLRRWFEYRMKKPRVRWSSPLDDITTSRWTSAMTEELRSLIAVLTGCIELEPEQAALLDQIAERRLITVSALEEAGVLPPPATPRRPIIDDGSTLF